MILVEEISDRSLRELT